MLLYRAQSVPSDLRVLQPQDNAPATRIAGRWFTDDVEAAHRHASGIAGPSQIICVELDDAVAESFRVWNTPFTRCGLAPINHSIDPKSDFVIPRFFAAQAEEIEQIAEEPSNIVILGAIRARSQMAA